MLVTTTWIANNYKKYNELYFYGVLPKIEFRVNRSKTRWGYAEYKWFRTGEVTPTAITLSNYYDSPENIKLTTLLHEMIHIYDYTTHPEHFVANGRHNRKYDAHGYFFKAEASRLAKDGWEIEKYVTAEEQSASCLSKKSEALENNKINNALLCVVVGTNGYNWMMKTSKGQAGMLVNTIKHSIWTRTLGTVKDINFYTFTNNKLATMRSNAVRLRGWRLDDETLSNKLVEYKANEVYNVA